MQMQLELRYITQHYTMYTNPPTPAPRQRRRLGPPQVWNFDQALWPQAFVASIKALQPAVCLHWLLGRSSLPFASQKTRKTPKTLQIHRGCLHQALRPQDHRRCGTSIRHSGHRHLLLRSKRCSLPFASIASIALCCSGVQACRLLGVKPLKPLKPPNPSRLLAPNTPATRPPQVWNFDQALWPQAFRSKRCSLPFASIASKALCC